VQEENSQTTVLAFRVPRMTKMKAMTKKEKSDLHVQPPLQKYFCSRLGQITCISLAIPSHTEGRFAIVTDVRRDAVDARSALTKALSLRTAKSCGPDAPTLASSSREASFLQVSRGRRWQESPVTGESAKETVKTIARGMPGDPA
jgi:hypothetical protein